jgi:hypothetical protein
MHASVAMQAWPTAGLPLFFYFFFFFLSARVEISLGRPTARPVSFTNAAQPFSRPDFRLKIVLNFSVLYLKTSEPNLL